MRHRNILLAVCMTIFINEACAQRTVPIPSIVLEPEWNTLELPNYQVPEYQRVELQCVICGRTLYEYRKTEVVPRMWQYDDMFPGSSSGWPWNDRHEALPDSLVPQSIGFTMKLEPVCRACQTQYKWIIDDLLDTWNTWRLDILDDNANSRTRRADARAQEAVQRAREAVRKAEQELRWLEHPEERPKPRLGIGFADSVTYRSISCDTLRICDSLSAKSMWIRNFSDSLVVLDSTRNMPR